jgi:hypothetical protein
LVYAADPAVITSIFKLFSGYGSMSFFMIYALDYSFTLKRRPFDWDEIGFIEACGIRGSAAILEFKDGLAFLSGSA